MLIIFNYSEIPLHDHPGMLLTGKVILGEIRKKSMDLVDSNKQFDIPFTLRYES